MPLKNALLSSLTPLAMIFAVYMHLVVESTKGKVHTGTVMTLQYVLRHGSPLSILTRLLVNPS